MSSLCQKGKGNKKRLSIDEFHVLAKERGGVCLSHKYTNNTTKLRWKCSKGHEWNAVPSSVKRGTWCRVCAGTALLSIDEMQLIAEERGGRCLTKEYTNSKSKLRWQCAEGHEWEAEASSVKHGRWCPVCAITKRSRALIKYSIKDAQRIAQTHNGNCLSEVYESFHKKLKWQCSLGHEWLTSLSKIKYGQWCPVCARKEGAIKRRLSI